MQFLRPCVDLRETEDNIPEAINVDESSNSNMDLTLDEARSDTQEGSSSSEVQQLEQHTLPVRQVSASSRGKTSDQGKKKKSQDNEELMTSLKSVVNVMEREKNNSYVLAMSLIPMIDEVPKENMFTLRRVLIDAIQSCIPQQAQAPSNPTPPATTQQYVDVDYSQLRYSQSHMPHMQVESGNVNRPRCPSTSNYSARGLQHPQENYYQGPEYSIRPYMNPREGVYSTHVSQNVQPINNGHPQVPGNAPSYLLQTPPPPPQPVVNAEGNIVSDSLRSTAVSFRESLYLENL